MAGIKGSGNEFHHDCDCEIVPSWDRKKAHIDGYDPDAMYDRYQQAREAVMNMGEDPNDSHTLLAVMRRLHPDAYKDGIGDQGRSDGTGRGTSKIPRRLQLGKVRSGKGGGDGTVDLTKYDTHRNEIIRLIGQVVLVFGLSFVATKPKGGGWTRCDLSSWLARSCWFYPGF